MAWETAVIVGWVGMVFVFIALSFIIDAMFLSRKENPIPIAPIFIIFAFLFSMNILLANKYIVQANVDSIGNASLSDALVSNAETGFIMMVWLTFAVGFISMTALTIYAVQKFLNRDTIKKPKTVRSK